MITVEIPKGSEYKGYHIQEGHITLQFSSAIPLNKETVEKTYAIVHNYEHVPEHYDKIDKLHEYTIYEVRDPNIYEAEKILERFVSTLTPYTGDQLTCQRYLEMAYEAIAKRDWVGATQAIMMLKERS